MSIEFRCSQCSQLLRVPDESAGKSARCPKCQALMTIPAASPSKAPPSGAVTSYSPPLPSSPPAPPTPLPPANPFAGGGLPPPPQSPYAQPPHPQTAYPQPPYPQPPPPKPPSNPFTEAGAPPPSLNPYASSSIPTSSYSTPYGPPNPNQGPMLLAIGSLITAAIGLLSCGCCVFMPFPAISLIMGIAALFQKPDPSARVIAIIGISISGLTLALIIIAMILWMAGMAADPQLRQAFGN